MRRSRLALLGALVLAGVVPAAHGGPGQVREVTMPGRTFAPGQIQVLVGDTVVWRNADGTNHTVTSNDDLFDSGYIAPGLTFAEAFSKPGHYLYHCSIHRFMRGEVVVVPVSLSAPAEPVVSGGRVVLRGLAPTGTARVTVVRAGKSGAVIGRVVPAGDGSFAVPLRVSRPENVIALAKGAASPTIHVAVAPTVRARRSGDVVAASASPARPRVRAALQRYDREHFAWQTIARGRLSAASRVTFALPVGGGRFRVVVRGGDGWADGASGTIVAARG